MPMKYVVSIFAAALIGYSISPSYSGDIISCDGFEGCDGAYPALEARIAELEALLADVSRGTDPNTDQETLIFSGINVQVVSGSGTTNGTKNGTGNLIIGYNELRGSGNDRTGSHMLVIGKQNNYTYYGGMVVGAFNTSSGVHASVSGGNGNTASGSYASVSGGSDNRASDSFASVSGGFDNAASAYAASVSGGNDNEAGGSYASVSGGSSKTADASKCTTAGNIGTDCP